MLGLLVPVDMMDGTKPKGLLREGEALWFYCLLLIACMDRDTEIEIQR